MFLVISTAEFGPFAIAVALVVATVSAVKAILFSVSGKYKSWRPPDEGLPGRLMVGIVSLAIISAVGSYIYIKPDNVTSSFLIGAICGLASFFLVPQYQKMARLYLIEIPDGPSTRIIVAGKKLLPKAAKVAKNKWITDKKQLLAGAEPPYNVNDIWDESDRTDMATRMSYLLMTVLALSVSSAIILAFCLQVFISQKRPDFDLQKLGSPKNSQKPNS